MDVIKAITDYLLSVVHHFYMNCLDMLSVPVTVHREQSVKRERKNQQDATIIIIIIFFHGLGRLTCSGIDALPSFPG